MTDQTIDALKEGVHKDRIAALRYLAFLDQERRTLIRELNPELKPGDMVWFPDDRHVNLLLHRSPLERAVTVLEAVGLPPYQEEIWTDLMDIRPGDFPVIGVVK